MFNKSLICSEDPGNGSQSGYAESRAELINLFGHTETYLAVRSGDESRNLTAGADCTAPGMGR